MWACACLVTEKKVPSCCRRCQSTDRAMISTAREKIWDLNRFGLKFEENFVIRRVFRFAFFVRGERHRHRRGLRGGPFPAAPPAAVTSTFRRGFVVSSPCLSRPPETTSEDEFRRGSACLSMSQLQGLKAPKSGVIPWCKPSIVSIKQWDLTESNADVFATFACDIGWLSEFCDSCHLFPAMTRWNYVS